MDVIKQFFYLRFKTYVLIGASMLFSLLILMVRIKLKHSFFYLFLVWNLFLAAIPFAISTYVMSHPKLHTYGLLLWCCVWLLFLPNAPYMVTDLLHLGKHAGDFVWLDCLVVVSFALCGLFLFYLSVVDMKRILSKVMTKRLIKFGFMGLPFLCAFGVYLGRFLRYNSWEVLNKPLDMAMDVFDLVCHPLEHMEAWLFTFLYGSFLTLVLWFGTLLKGTEPDRISLE